MSLMSLKSLSPLRPSVPAIILRALGVAAPPLLTQHLQLTTPRFSLDQFFGFTPKSAPPAPRNSAKLAGFLGIRLRGRPAPTAKISSERAATERFPQHAGRAPYPRYTRAAASAKLVKAKNPPNLPKNAKKLEPPRFCPRTVVVAQISKSAVSPTSSRQTIRFLERRRSGPQCA